MRGRAGKSKVCREISDRGYAWKFSSLFQMGQEVTTGSAHSSASTTTSPAGRFATMGRSTGIGIYGPPADRSALAPPTRHSGAVLTPRLVRSQFGLNHMHNVYWRLDLDVGGAGNNAVNKITEARHTGSSPDGVSCAIAGTCHINKHTKLTAEGVERLAPFKTCIRSTKGRSMLMDVRSATSSYRRVTSFGPVQARSPMQRVSCT